MPLVLLPVLISRDGVRRMVYVDTTTLEVAPFHREVAGATAFNGVGVLAPEHYQLPCALAAAATEALAAQLSDDLRGCNPDELTLTFIPFR